MNPLLGASLEGVPTKPRAQPLRDPRLPQLPPPMGRPIKLQQPQQQKLHQPRPKERRPAAALSWKKVGAASCQPPQGPAAYFFLATPWVRPRRPVVLVCWPRTRRPLQDWELGEDAGQVSACQRAPLPGALRWGLPTGPWHPSSAQPSTTAQTTHAILQAQANDGARPGSSPVVAQTAVVADLLQALQIVTDGGIDLGRGQLRAGTGTREEGEGAVLGSAPCHA